VRGKQNRDARFVDVLEQAEDIQGELRVEVAGGLVRQHQGGFAHDGSRHGHALLFAAGQVADSLVAPPAEPDPLQNLAHTPPNESLRQSEHLERNSDVLDHVPVENEPEVLEDDADVAPQVRNRIASEPADLAPHEQDPTRVDALGGVQQPEQRALSGTGGAGDEDELPTLHREAEAPKHGQVGPERLVRVLEYDDRTIGGRRIESIAGSQRRLERSASGSSIHTRRGSRRRLTGTSFVCAPGPHVRGQVFGGTPASGTVNIAFFGLPLAALALNRDGHDLTLAALSPVECPGRRRLGRVLAPERIVDALGLSRERHERLVERRLAETRPDLLVCWFWTRQLPDVWLARPRLGGVGVHPSLLPRHRGPDPFFWTIDSGDAEAGISVYRLDAEYDTGPILWQETLSVGGRNSWQLARALDRPGLAALRHVVASLGAGTRLPARPQVPALATWARRPEGSDLRVEWGWSTERVLRRIRALAPVPGLALELIGVRFFVLGAEARSPSVSALQAGEAQIGTEVTVRTGDGAIALTRVLIDEEADLTSSQYVDARQLADRVRSAEGLPAATTFGP
jgi:methionyl-tRNA formyltransferase